VLLQFVLCSYLQFQQYSFLLFYLDLPLVLLRVLIRIMKTSSNLVGWVCDVASCDAPEQVRPTLKPCSFGTSFCYENS
jgi:hypothetical protein